jgi:DNA-binding NarL/FixJ family response regulator
MRAECRILVADDDPIVRELLRSSIATIPGMQVVGEASDGQQILDAIEKLNPDVLMLDLLLPTMHGLSVLRSIRMKHIRPAVVVFAAAISKHDALEAFRLGARAVLPKRWLNRLSECLIRVRNGHYWFGDQGFETRQETLRQLLDEPDAVAAANGWGLTTRELQVVHLVASGNTNCEIAGTFGIAEVTVKRHIANIYRKCGVSN